MCEVGKVCKEHEGFSTLGYLPIFGVYSTNTCLNFFLVLVCLTFSFVSIDL